jgi:preprotein translocase subunit SecF
MMECFVESSKLFGAGMLVGVVVGFVGTIVLVLDFASEMKELEKKEDKDE